MGIYYGAAVNAVAIAAGGLLGTLLKKQIPVELSRRAKEILGYATLLFGVQMGVRMTNALFVITSLLIGTVFGYAWEKRPRRQRAHPTRARSAHFQTFLDASLIYCTGSMAILGSIEAGSQNIHTILLSKSGIDGVIAVSLSAALGPGVLFSAIPVFLYEGLLTLFSGQAAFLKQEAVLANLSGVGGVLLLLIGISISGLKDVPVGRYFPAILVALALSAVWPF